MAAHPTTNVCRGNYTPQKEISVCTRQARCDFIIGIDANRNRNCTYSYAVLAVPQADHSRYRTRVGESHIPQSSFRFPISLLYPLNSLWSSRLYPTQPLIRPEHIGLDNSMRLGSIANKITAKGENIRQSHLLFWRYVLNGMQPQ